MNSGTLLLALLAALMVAQQGVHPGKKKGGRADRKPVAMKIVDSAALRTGIAGEVVMRPTRPVEADGVIATAPLAGATILVQDADHGVLGKVTSDSAGRFYLQLLPGTHYLYPQALGRKMFPHPLDSKRVYVNEGKAVHVVLEYDTGIR
ncbi:MAG TPA: carboxypeptidase-like regulatory domain-containing protein [Candidatus Kapabacteria bacterium]|nr:carboxypeptidase-like regulatory domain-containing protein [Candidatus Kapabacteria bacterium]